MVSSTDCGPPKRGGDQIDALGWVAKSAECGANVRPVMRCVVRDVQHGLPKREPLLDMTGDTDVSHLAIEVAIHDGVEQGEAAAFNFLPPPDDRIGIGEVRARWQRSSLSPCQRRSQISSAPTM